MPALFVSYSYTDGYGANSTQFHGDVVFADTSEPKTSSELADLKGKLHAHLGKFRVTRILQAITFWKELED